jgi:hypothetical protein
MHDTTLKWNYPIMIRSFGFWLSLFFISFPLFAYALGLIQWLNKSNIDFQYMVYFASWSILRKVSQESIFKLPGLVS